MKKLIMKSAIKISLALIIFVLILFASTIGFVSNENKSNQTPLKYSKDFQALYFTLTSQKVEAEKIQKSISLLRNSFEKDFANALLFKRKQKFDEAFKLLEKHLYNYPADYRFYDELVLLALISNKSDDLEKKILNKDRSSYIDYLKALLAYHKGNFSNSVELLKDKSDAEPLLLLSQSFRATGDYQKAGIIIDSCLKIYPKENPDYCRMIISKGSLYLLSGKNEEAEKLYTTGYNLATENKNQKEEAKALINLAILDDYNGNVDEAQKKLDKALNLAKEIEDIELQAIAYSETGVSFTYSGEIVEARKNYEKSFELFSKLKNSERLANLSANIGSLYVQTANFSAAIKSFEEGLKFAGENTVSRILNLRGLGDVYSNLSDYSKALEYYNEAKELSEKIKNVNQKALSEISIGTLYYNLNRPGKALSTFNKVADEIAGTNDPYLLEDLLFKSALAYTDLDSLIIAEQHFRKALSIAETVSDIYYEALIPTYLADNLIRQKKYRESETLLNGLINKSFVNGFTHLVALQNLYLGISNYHQKNYSNAKNYLIKADKTAFSVNDLNTAIEAKYYQALCFENDGKYADAEKYFLEAISLVEKSSSSASLNTQAEVFRFAGLKDSYLKLTDFYLRQSGYSDAFDMIERFRARNTFRNLNELKLQSSVNNEDLIKNYYDIKWKLNADIYSVSEKDSLQRILNSIQNEFTIKYNFNPDYERKPFSINSALSKIPEGEVLLSYYFNSDDVYAFILKKNSFTPVKLQKSKREIMEIVRMISPVYDNNHILSDAYYNQDLFSFNSEAANKLYEALIKPLKEKISDEQKIIFSLPVELSVVPMEFLVTEFNSTDSPFYYNNKKFLIEDFSISYTPSFSVYRLQREKPVVQNGKVLLVGDPQITQSDFAQSYRGSLIEDQTFSSRSLKLFPLRYSREEVEQIGNMLSDASVLLSADATEEKFIENVADKSLIHLSTHSFIHNDQPFIIFSREAKDKSDGYLETGEIVKLKLNSELVVLSSCKSGLGTIDVTEGVLGMQKSFFEAGSKSVVVSLWDVNDKYTSYFMKSFYKYLSEGYSKSEALRLAKLFFKENYSANPYYWAAFVLSGDNSSINFSKSIPFRIKYPVILISLLILFYISYRAFSGKLR
ncbi:CHAT domain-containing protein [Ignavibacterium album]|uniref:CHAT domain-containing protein n=1 Tax=Ignavibacterium album TaxID=591197 RepID=UPI0026EC4273|nr:CHAT domain-containing protein [Ignavibacterium album]